MNRKLIWGWSGSKSTQTSPRSVQTDRFGLIWGWSGSILADRNVCGKEELVFLGLGLAVVLMLHHRGEYKM